MEPVRLHYEVLHDFTTAGEASSECKKALRRLGVDAETIRRVAICMYEGEINMVIHAHGGAADVEVTPGRILIQLIDRGPGIPDVDAAMQEGFSTATDSVRDLGFGAGMGLPNMKRYADDIAVTSTVGVGTTVKMEIKF